MHCTIIFLSLYIIRYCFRHNSSCALHSGPEIAIFDLHAVLERVKYHRSPSFSAFWAKSTCIHTAKMAEEVDYGEDVDMTEGLKVSVSTDAKGSSGRKVTAVKAKGRGHDKGADAEEDRYNGRGGVFENIQRGGGSGPLQCKLSCKNTAGRIIC